MTQQRLLDVELLIIVYILMKWIIEPGFFLPTLSKLFAYGD